MSDGARCSAASLARAEEAIGTASTVRTFVLVELPGPWGEDALRSRHLSTELRHHLAGAPRAGVRVLAIRRHGRRDSPHPSSVYVAHASPAQPFLQRAELEDADELVDAAWGEVVAGTWEPAGPHDEPMFCVCTHGRHDACCAERGRPLAAALHAAHPTLTWEVSHIGGDRFAGNVLVLPHGLYYGRLTPTPALELVDAHLRGELDLQHLRGRSSLPMPAQAAEILLRRELAEPREGAVRVGRISRDGEVTVVRLETDEASYDVRVRTRPAARAALLTCRAARPERAPVHELVAMEQVLH